MRSGATPETSYLRFVDLHDKAGIMIPTENDSHNCENAALSLCRFPDTIANFITNAPDPFIARLQIALSREPLKENSIDPMLRHPMEMSRKGMNGE